MTKGFNPFRDSHGRFAAGHGTKRYSLTPDAGATKTGGPNPKHAVKHEAANGSKVVMTKNSYQVWSGDKLVHEVPATKAWRQDLQAAKTFADEYKGGTSPMDSAIRGASGSSRKTVEATPETKRPAGALGAKPPVRTLDDEGIKQRYADRFAYTLNSRLTGERGTWSVAITQRDAKGNVQELWRMKGTAKELREAKPVLENVPNGQAWFQLRRSSSMSNDIAKMITDDEV